MPEELQDATDTVTYDSRTKMTHVHVLGNVGAREIDNSSLLLEFLILVDGQFGRLKNFVHLLLNEVILKNNVQKEASFGRISLPCLF
jgi:hypothetical protein